MEAEEALKLAGRTGSAADAIVKQNSQVAFRTLSGFLFPFLFPCIFHHRSSPSRVEALFRFSSLIGSVSLSSP